MDKKHNVFMWTTYIMQMYVKIFREEWGGEKKDITWQKIPSLMLLNGKITKLGNNLLVI